MQSMKLTDDEKKEGGTGLLSAPKQEYPYGLNIHLDESALQKLGMKELPDVGETMALSAKIKVVSVGDHQTEDGRNRSVDMQITHLELGGEQTSADKAKKLFGLEKGHSGATASEGNILQ